MKKHKLLSCLLVVAMIFSLLPVSVFAADPVEAPVDTYGGLEDGTADPNWAGNQTPKVVSSEENLKAVLAQTLNPEASNYKNVLYLQIGSNFSIDSADYNALTLGGAGAEIWIDGNGKTITGEANYDFPLFFQKYASTVHIKDLTVTSHGKGVANPGVYNSVFWTQVNDASLDLRNVTIKDFGRYGIRIMAGTLTLTGGEIDCGQDSKNTTGIQAGGSADEGDTATVTVDGTTIKDSKYATWTEWCSAAIEALPGSNVNIKSATITGSNIGVLLDNATEVRGEHKADISVTIGQNGASNDTVTITAKEKADNDGAAVLFGSAGYGSTISGNVDLTINAGTFSLIDHDSDSASDSSALQVTFDGPNSTQGGVGNKQLAATESITINGGSYKAVNPLEEYEQYFNLPSGKSLINVGTDDAPVFELGTIYSVNAPENGYVSGDGSNYFKALMAPAGFRGTLYVAPESGYAFARGSRVVLKNADTGAVIAQSESEFASATDDAQSFSNVTMPSADVTVEANIVAKKPQLAAPEVKFSASATDATKATLSYADVAERTLQYTLDEGGNWTDLSDTSTELNDLAAGMKIWVQAYSKSGAAPASGIVKFNVGQAAAPSGVKLMGTDTDKGNLTGLQLGDTYQVNSGTTYTIASAAEGNNVVLTDGVKEVGSLSSGNVIHVTRAGSKDVVATVGGAAVNLKSAAYDITLTQATENPSVTVTQPTVKDGNGSISTSNAMEIKLNTPTSNENEAFHDWTKCTGATAVKPGSYDVRNAGGENMLAGTARTAVVVKNLAETPSLTIATTGADSATISDGTTSSSTALEWSVDGGTNWTDATLSSGTADISGLKAGDLMLRVKEDGDTLASAAQTIKLTQPAAPTTPAANSTNDGLTGVTDKMEYGTSTSYGNAVTTNATTVDGLIAGTNYYVRYKADGKNALASEPIIVHLHSADSSKVVITYDMNGYGTQIAPKEVQLTGEPAKFTLTASEAPATYTDGVPTDAVELSGWKIGETTVTADSTAITSDTTLVAQWTKENMTVTVTNPGNSDVIKVNNGSNNANLTTAKVGDTITLTAVPAANRFFKSWAVTKTSGADAVKVTGNTFVMPEFPVTVVGTFDAIARIYVTFDPNGGTLNGTSPRQTGVDGKLVASEIPSATQSGQVFSGWYTEKSGGTYVDKDTVFTGGTDVTVYAHWSTAGAGGSVSGGTTGGSTGGSSSGSTGTTTPGTTTSTNADGSTTTTTTAANGTVTETTTAADGSKTETVTRTDGSSTKTETTASGAEVKTETAADGSATVEGKDANGTTASAKTDTDGKLTEAKANVTAATVTAAVTAATAANEKPVVTLPVEVPAATSAETAASIVIDMPASVSAENPVKVEIPVEDVKTSTVVVIVKEDGTEEIVKDCTVTKDGVVLGVEGNVTVKVVDNTKTFSDSVPNWAADEVNFVTSREIFNGSDGQFNAEQTTSRAMIAQVLFNFDKESGNSTETGSFGDAAGKWFDEAASWASSLGVVNGDNGNFNGDAAVTRQDLATMLFRYATARGFDTSVKGGESSFSDASDVAGYAATAMQWAVENGIINGIDGALQPTGSATRAQVAAMMARFVKNVAN